VRLIMMASHGRTGLSSSCSAAKPPRFSRIRRSRYWSYAEPAHATLAAWSRLEISRHWQHGSAAREDSINLFDAVH